MLVGIAPSTQLPLAHPARRHGAREAMARPARAQGAAQGAGSLTCRGWGQPSWGWLWGGSSSPSPGCSLAWLALSSSQAGEPSVSRALQTQHPRSPNTHPGQAGPRVPGRLLWTHLSPLSVSSWASNSIFSTSAWQEENREGSGSGHPGPHRSSTQEPGGGCQPSTSLAPALPSCSAPSPPVPPTLPKKPLWLGLAHPGREPSLVHPAPPPRFHDSRLRRGTSCPPLPAPPCPQLPRDPHLPLPSPHGARHPASPRPPLIQPPPPHLGPRRNQPFPVHASPPRVPSRAPH